MVESSLSCLPHAEATTGAGKPGVRTREYVALLREALDLLALILRKVGFVGDLHCPVLHGVDGVLAAHRL